MIARNVIALPINSHRKAYILRQSKRLLLAFWGIPESAARDALARLPISPTEIAIAKLGLTIEEPEELDVREFTRGPRLEAAGLLDGAKKRIAVAKKFSPIIRRFTLAHEIAHYLLHGRQLLLREPPITDATFERPSKSIHEREANLFAAELLMPSFLVETVFTRLFGAPIDSSRIDENEAFRITSGKIPASALRKMSVRDLSKFVASNSSLTFKSDRPLAEIFQVSSTAMAIQLEELRLVRGD